ncbi:hypothetical protein [Nocardia brasiliensis]|uniref:hypothetical protein n=1 Tax=Nocardia brasiliensis TaxID=37326 RepID=UPI0011DCA593|nr:hypothetical protein [Nocardia brasiliensis]
MHGASADDFGDHYIHRVCLRPGQAHSSPIWNNYFKLLTDPFADEAADRRYCDEDELHELIWQTWSEAGVDNDVSIDHELDLSTGTAAARGCRIDFLATFDDEHRAGVEVKGAGWWAVDVVQDQLVRYAETGQIDSLLLLTADPEMTEIDWPRHLEVPLFIVLITGRRGRL